MIRCIVIDDEPLAVKLMANYVKKHEGLQLVNTYHDPIKALHEIDAEKVDLIFLDIQMPQLTGIQFLKILNNQVPVILTTAYNEYALESYDYQVVDYLIKPISFERFSKSINKFQSLFKAKESVHETKEKASDFIDSIFIKSGHKTIRVDLDTVKYLESKGDYLHIFSEQETYKTLENLKDILARLNSDFLRCHRSFIVNMKKITFIENNRMVIGEDYIPISRAYSETVRSFVNEGNKN